MDYYKDRDKQDRFTTCLKTCRTGSLFWRVGRVRKVIWCKDFDERLFKTNITGTFIDCFLGKTRLARNLDMGFKGGMGVGSLNAVTRPGFHM